MRQFFSIFGRKSTSIKVTFSQRKKKNETVLLQVSWMPRKYMGGGEGGGVMTGLQSVPAFPVFCFVLFCFFF